MCCQVKVSATGQFLSQRGPIECLCVTEFLGSKLQKRGGLCPRGAVAIYGKKKLSRTGYLAEVLMGLHQMALKIWSEVVHWIQLAQAQSVAGLCQSSMNIRIL
jgi:hypothetical protein